MKSEAYWAKQEQAYLDMGFASVRYHKYRESLRGASPYSIPVEDRNKYEVIVRPSSSGQWGKNRCDTVAKITKEITNE